MENNIKAQFGVLVDALGKLTEIDVSKDCIEYVEDIIKSCGTYIERVTAMEAAISTARFIMEPEDFRAYVGNLDKSRKMAHDGLLANLAILNRYCRLAEVSPIYTGDLNNRYEAADFALLVVNTFFEERKL